MAGSPGAEAQAEPEDEMKSRGMGQTYKRGRVWWVQYCFRGQVFRESSRSERASDAAKLLRQRQAEMGRGRLIGPDAERTTFDDLANLLFDDYRANGRKSLARAQQCVAHLREFYGRSRAIDITPASATTYVRRRREEEAAQATIRNELGTLGRMFTLAYREGVVPSRPPFPSVQVRNTRAGFFEEPELRAVLKHLPEYMRPFVETAFLTGWRRGELRELTWKQVDFHAGTIRLEPGSTKNEEGRTFPFSALPRLAALLIEQRERTSAFERSSGQVVRWVFHRQGKQVGDYREAWRTACRKAGVPGRLVHDLRRSAVRRLERAGVPRSVAMKLTGHKTENVYRRYAIVSESDLALGVAKVAALDGEQFTRAQAVGDSGEAVSARTSTVLTQSGESGAAVVRGPMAQGLGNSSLSVRGMAGREWRPQRDSNSQPAEEAPDTIGAEPAPDGAEE